MGITGIKTIGYDGDDEKRRPGLLAIAQRIKTENPKMRDGDVLTKAKDEWHRSQRFTPSPASGRPDQP